MFFSIDHFISTDSHFSPCIAEFQSQESCITWKTNKIRLKIAFFYFDILIKSSGKLLNIFNYIKKQAGNIFQLQK